MMWMHYCTYGLQVYLPTLVCGPSCARPLTSPASHFLRTDPLVMDTPWNSVRRLTVTLDSKTRLV